MNKKICLLNDRQQKVYCVISPEENPEREFEKVFSIQRGYGFSVEVSDTEVRIVDYFAGDTRARFPIVNISQTQEAVCYQLTPLPDDQ